RGDGEALRELGTAGAGDAVEGEALGRRPREGAERDCRLRAAVAHQHRPDLAGRRRDSVRGPQCRPNPNAYVLFRKAFCEQAYTMAQNLDPNSDGRGVLQFKTDLMSMIKIVTMMCNACGDSINCIRGRVDDMQREEQKLRESGPSRANLGDSDAYCKLAEQRRWPALFPGGGSGGVSKLAGAVNLVLNGMNIVIVLTSPQTTGISMLIMEGRLELRSSEMKKVFATWRALVEVMEALSKDAAPDGVGRLIVEEVRKIKKSDAPLAGELTPYNIVPLEAPSLTNAIGFFPEVRGAISALRYSENFRFPAGFELLALRDVDMFDLLEYVFGFQDAARNDNGKASHSAWRIMMILMNISALAETTTSLFMWESGNPELCFDYCRYVLYWLVIFACKFTFAYFLQASSNPLICDCTNISEGLGSDGDAAMGEVPVRIIHTQSNGDGLSRCGVALLQQPWVYSNIRISTPNFEAAVAGKKAVQIVPTAAELLYLSLPEMMWASDLQREDFLVWAYDLHCFLPGNSSLEAGRHRQPAMVVSLFRAGPNYTSGSPARRNFQILLVGMPFNVQSSQVSQDSNKIYASIFSPFWNEIIKSLRKEDLSVLEGAMKQLHLLLTVKDSATNIPKNLEARRLEFFTNSLFMDMPTTKPVSEMMPFCVFTPYYSETVLYSSSELRVENEDGISTLFYLHKIFPDEWDNFLERIGRGDSGDAELQENSCDSLVFWFWVSYRGQTLARTVRGMMYHRRALMLQSFLENRLLEEGYSQANFLTTEGFELSREARVQTDIKFTYVVVCQIYGQQKQRKAPEAADIALLFYIFDLVFRWGLQRQCFEGQLASGSMALRTGDELTGCTGFSSEWFTMYWLLCVFRNEALRVAFIHVEVIAAADGTILKEFYSKLVKADINGKDQEIFSNKLPGDPKLGEGKPENQNHAIIFTRGEAVQSPLT
ncbi:hypothetical protein C3L33_06585, partial [Rhododendron williamsianum]